MLVASLQPSKLVKLRDALLPDTCMFKDEAYVRRSQPDCEYVYFIVRKMKCYLCYVAFIHVRNY